MKTSFSEVRKNLTEIANREEYTEDVLYELMAAYGRAAAAITRLRNGTSNVAKDKENSVLQRGVVYFKVLRDYSSLPAEVEKLEQDPLTQRYNPRFLIATDLKSFAAKDTKKGNTLEIPWANMDRYVDFFYGWTGDEVTDEKTEAIADRRAAEKMKELYQEIERVNTDRFNDTSKDFRHELNVFFSRLLFCFFAEDTKVFSSEEDNLFTNSIRDFTQVDGSDLDEFLNTLFESLDEKDKSAYTSPYSKFPYVNGKLFDKERKIEIPKFNAQARHLILSCGGLSWAEINPDIFGSMFQGIVDEEHRATHGMHYTSVPNIMKTIEPLFLDELREEFDKHYDNPKKLQQLHERISKIKIFDPACGSGNFLIIAYKELRKLEHAIIERLFEDEYIASQLKNKLESRIELDNFYGIEIDDFACEVAVLSLYLAKHQMNIEFEKQFGKEIKLIPLKDNAHIRQGNAARIDWQEVCPNKPKKQNLIREEQVQLIVTGELNEQQLVVEEWDEIYLIGNPPYLGGKTIKEPSMKEDVRLAHQGRKYSKNVDYISIWFTKGSEYIKGSNAKLAFVSTNSVCQGEQVEMIWPHVFNLGIEICFAYTSFKWQNSAKGQAGVTCIIVGLANKGQVKQKAVFTEDIKIQCSHINAYLVPDGGNVVVGKRSSMLSSLPKMVLGSMPKDGGGLVIDADEYNRVSNKYPDIIKYFKKYLGSAEYIRDIDRYCIWIEDGEVESVKNHPFIESRLDIVKSYRRESDAESTRDYADFPHRFIQRAYSFKQSLIVPRVTSERREYVIAGYLDQETVISDAANAVYGAELWLFSIITSKIHVVWVKAVAGRLKTDIRYSSAIVYNTFPISQLTDIQKRELNDSARKILFARENHTEKTIAEMYDPDKMPDDLREAHHQNDILVDKLYRQKPYNNDEERLADLFKLYEEMIVKEKK